MLDYDIKDEYEEFTRDLEAVADQLDQATGDEALSGSPTCVRSSATSTENCPTS